MKVKEISKHCNATKIAVIKNCEPFDYITEIDYMQIEDVKHVNYCSEHDIYGTWVRVPEIIKNMTVDFISPNSSRELSIYVK